MASNGGDEPEQMRKLFIGGLNFDTTDESLLNYFEQFGNVTDCIVMKSAGQSRGFGFVTFAKMCMADDVMEKRPHKLDGRTITPRRAVSKEDSEKPGAHASVKKIYVGGIKESMNEQMIQEYFEKYGNVESVELLKESGSDKKRGFGFVTFADHDPVDKIIGESKFHNIGSFSCEVRKAIPKAEFDKIKRGSFSRRGDRGPSPPPYYGRERGGSYRRSPPPSRYERHPSDYDRYERYPPSRDYDRYPPSREFGNEYDRYRQMRDYGGRSDYPRSPPDYYRREERDRPPSFSDRDRGGYSSFDSREPRGTRDARDLRFNLDNSRSSGPDYDSYSRSREDRNGYEFSSYMKSSSSFGPSKSSLFSSKPSGPYGTMPRGTSGGYSSSSRY